MVCFLEGILGRHGEKPDFRMALAKQRDEPIVDNNDYRLLLEIIGGCCNQTDDPEKIRVYLERGIEMTGMSAEALSQYTLDMGLPELAEYYSKYHE